LRHPSGHVFLLSWLIQTVRNLSWPTVTGGTVMAIATPPACQVAAEQLRLLSVELFFGQYPCIPEFG
jgi:hypothetical protein